MSIDKIMCFLVLFMSLNLSLEDWNGGNDLITCLETRDEEIHKDVHSIKHLS